MFNPFTEGMLIGLEDSFDERLGSIFATQVSITKTLNGQSTETSSALEFKECSSSKLKANLDR